MGKIHEAIKTVQGQVTALEQTEARIEHRGGGHHSYTYLSEPTLMDALRPLLSAAGVAVYVDLEDRGKDGNLYRSRATMTMAHYEDDSQVVVYADGQASASDDKGLAMAHTSALRQLLHKTFLVPNYRQGDDPEQRPAPPVQDADQEALMAAIEQVRGLAEAKGLGGYAEQQIQKAEQAGGLNIAYTRELYKAIRAAEAAEPTPEAPAPAPAPAGPENGSQAVDPRLLAILGELQTAKADGDWATRMASASQNGFGKPPEALTADEASKLLERMQATLLTVQQEAGI